MSQVLGNVSSVFRQGLFSDKVAIVTGGATGIGKAITRELLHLGCNVVIAARKLERLQQFENELKTKYPGGTAGKPTVASFECNIRNEEHVRHLMKNTLETFGRIDYLINNGGGQFVSPLSKVSLKGWNAVIETNLTGTFLMCREAYASWMQNNGGVIINIVMNNLRGMPLMGHSGAARSGVENFSKTLAVEWAADGVRINCVAPGVIYSDTAAANYGDPKLFHQAIPTIPQQRLGTVEEVSSLVCFLLAPASSHITGETIRLDGGQSLYGTPMFEIPDHKKSIPYTWDDKEKSKL